MPLVVRKLVALRNLQRKLGDARRTIVPEVAKRVGAAMVKLVADEFRSSVDPNGEPWAPVVRNRKRDRNARARRARLGKPARADKPLVDTGRLRGSVVSQVTFLGTSVRVLLPVSYASYHQYGTKYIRRRQILPEGGLPEKWSAAVKKAARAVMREKLKGG